MNHDPGTKPDPPPSPPASKPEDVVNPFELRTLQGDLWGLGLTKLATLLGDAGLVQTLSFLRGTLFAPTNEALDGFLPDTPLDPGVLKSTLFNHVTIGKGKESKSKSIFNCLLNTAYFPQYSPETSLMARQ